ncbi:TPA: hypothetical protein DEP96_01370 [Candidatus Uhrbacteria bacterium]|nr:hypothetical protein [Candidatus Uhrbacteria bacterium]
MLTNLMIDGDAAPEVEPNWAVASKTAHTPCGQVDPTKLILFQTEEMKRGGRSEGTVLSDLACQAGLNPMNANGATFLKRHKKFLAKVPKTIKYLIFPETKYFCGNGFWFFLCLDRSATGKWEFKLNRIVNSYCGQCAIVAFRVDEPTK